MAKNDLNHPRIWEDNASYLFLNPRLTPQDQLAIEKHVQKQNRSGTVWLKSSGTEMSHEGRHKLVALDKKAILYAAMAVNKFFSLKGEDVWLNGLPHFHIGGLAIYARAYLSGSEVVLQDQWSLQEFARLLSEEKITVTSLVPTQIFDLVEARTKAPESLRFVFVGGGALEKNLYVEARELGWPLIPSYGMTETSAMLAAASPSSLYQREFPEMEILPHIQLEKRENDLVIRSQALLSGYLFVDGEKSNWMNIEEEFMSDDRVEIVGNSLKVLGRATDLVKILGETVDIAKLEAHFAKNYSNKAFVIIAKPESRRGYRLILVSESNISKDELKKFNDSVMPFERIEASIQVSKLPRTSLGKIIKKEVLNQLN